MEKTDRLGAILARQIVDTRVIQQYFPLMLRFGAKLENAIKMHCEVRVSIKQINLASINDVTYCIVGKFGMEFNLAVWWILAKLPNLIPPIAQCLYMKQWLIFRLPPN